ncbi:helix-turn-helix domain-containing protein [Rhodobacterales bacterium HKCCE2091]|nr:helix-turn-helix domain-containing protein [Rhodobacterales bacterium HKCCE2091]
MAEIATFGGKATRVDEATVRDRAVSDLLVQVGERVRKAREMRGIPRRVLSEMSGVSHRYLAELEAGTGNISIGLLNRVAIALDHKIEWLVGEDDPWTSEALRVSELYRSADRATRDDVLRILNPQSLRDNRAERICLVGLRGAGKSTLGRLAASELGIPFLELNKEIELYGGMPVGDIMALYGPEGYRKLEADSLDKVIANYERVILAVAGGIVAEPATYNRLLTHFHTIWLRASPQEHMDRVRAQGDERPMEGNPEAMSQLRSILKSREALYERAQAQLDTSDAPLETSLSALVSIIRDQKFLE